MPLSVSRFAVPLEMSGEPSWFFFTTRGRMRPRSTHMVLHFMRRRSLMLSFSLARERHQLEARAVSLPSGRLSLLAEAEPRLPVFRTWLEALEYARARKPWHAEMDLVLRAVFRALRNHERRCRGPWREDLIRFVGRWLQAALLGFLAAPLASMHRRTRGWERDPEERWRNILLAFIETAGRLDLDRHESDLANWLLDRTHDLHRSRCRKRWRADRRVRLWEGEGRLPERGALSDGKPSPT
jgi:hypothetical protein